MDNMISGWLPIPRFIDTLEPVAHVTDLSEIILRSIFLFDYLKQGWGGGCYWTEEADFAVTSEGVGEVEEVNQWVVGR